MGGIGGFPDAYIYLLLARLSSETFTQIYPDSGSMLARVNMLCDLRAGKTEKH